MIIIRALAYIEYPVNPPLNRRSIDLCGNLMMGKRKKAGHIPER
jgi:hypothetical protein